MRQYSNIEALSMDGSPPTFIQELTIKTGLSRSSRLLMETVLVVSPQSHGIIGEIGLTLESATTTRFSSISPAPANSPPYTLDMISTAVGKGVLHLEELGGGI
jgi:hypothetical protein